MSEAIMDRIAKLLAKAKGTNNEHEAAIFAAKAAEMLAEHNLTETMVAARQAGKDDPITEKAYAGRAPDVWRLRILQGCARLYFCTMLHSGTKQHWFIGRAHNVAVAESMADWLIATVKRMAREHSPLKSEQGDFRRGAGDRLYERLVALHRAQAAPDPIVAGGNPGNLPALYASELMAARQWIANKYGDAIGPGKARGHSYKGASALAGRNAADRIGLNTQVAAERRADRMIGSK